MVSAPAIGIVLGHLQKATCFSDIFGALPDADKETRQRFLRNKFSELAILVHPDHASEDGKATANEAFILLKEFRDRALRAIEADTYMNPFKDENSSFELQSASGTTYIFDSNPFRQGDFSVLYVGKVKGLDEPVVAKIAQTPPCNTWLEREATILSRFKTDGKYGDINKYVPQLQAAFQVEGERGTRYWVNVMNLEPGFVSLSDIVETYPKGLDPRDAAWVARRVIAQVIAAEVIGVIHGAITPDHVLVHPLSHNPIHIGWANSVDISPNARIPKMCGRWQNFYPPEAMDNEKVDQRTDIFMAGKTIIYILGGDTRSNQLPKSVPSAVAGILLAMVEKFPDRRPQNGRQILDDFTRVIRAKWGKEYRPLQMPVC